MTRDDPASPLAARAFGVALGASPGLAAFIGHQWGGIGPATGLMLALLVTLGAVLGSLTWPHFLDNELAPSLWFSSLFAATCGMLAVWSVSVSIVCFLNFQCLLRSTWQSRLL